MSRREDRTSDAKRHRSRFDREPSPKRSRRDGKPETETPLTNSDDRNRGQKSRRRLQDALPLEDPLVHDSKNETKTMRKESEDKNNENQGGTKHSADPTKVIRSTSHFQHDNRGSAGQYGRSFTRRSDKERGWWTDRKEQPNDWIDDTTVASDAQQKDERPKNIRASDTQRKDDKPKDGRDVWRHTGYFEMEANRKPSERKKPAFREQKIPSDPEKTNKAADLVTPNPQDRAVESGKRRVRPSYGEREFNKSDGRRGKFFSMDRNGAGSRNRGRDGFGGGRGSRPNGGGVEKWKHDLYHEANRSPTPKNEEDQISKIEALLAK